MNANEAAYAAAAALEASAAKVAQETEAARAAKIAKAGLRRQRRRERKAAQEAREEAYLAANPGQRPVCMYGRIRRETEKAILFARVKGVHGGQPGDDYRLPAEVWLPKSQIAILDRALGDLDQVIAPHWLLAAKEVI